MKQYFIFCTVMVLCSIGIAQPVVTSDDVSEFLPYQIMSFLTTTLDDVTLSDDTTNTIKYQGKLIPYRKGQLWGYCDVQKNMKIPVQYEYASMFHANVAYVRKGGDYFFINKNGEELSMVNWIASNNEFPYGAPTHGAQDNTYFLAQGKDKAKQATAMPINSSSTIGLLKVFNKAKRAGVVDVYGATIVPIRYDNISFEKEGMVMTILDNKYGLYNKDGKEVSIPKYNSIGAFKNGIAKVRISHRYGYINTNGKEIIPTKYTSVYRKDGYIRASDDDYKKGILNLEGEIIIPFQYKNISALNNNFFVATNTDRKKGIVDLKHKIIQPFIYKSISSDEGEVFIAEKEEGYVYIHGKTGKLLTNTVYKKADKFDDRSLARVSNEKNEKGFIDRNGKEVITLKWYSADWFKNGYSEVRLSSDSGTTGLIDATGKLVVDTKYSDIIVFEKAKRAAVRNWKLHKDKWAFIDFNEKMLSAFEYDRVVKKKNGFSIVEKDDLEGVLNASGQQVLGCQYKDINIVNDRYMILKDAQGNYGTSDLTGKVLEPCQYDRIFKTASGSSVVETNEGKIGVINNIGKLNTTHFYDEIYRPKHWDQKSSTDYFVVTLGTLKGMLSTTGKVLITPKYYKLYYMINDLTLVDVTGEGKQYGYVGLNGVEYFEE